MQLQRKTLASRHDVFSLVNLDRLWLIIGLGVVIRLVFIGFLNLLPEEAYYWSYAKHLDTGYLDHPPMVAWLIYISESLLGRSELAVRLPAFLGWFVFAFFMCRFAQNTVGDKVGKPVLLLLVSLPIYMSVGFLMTPDAPFYICWAGALFFLERAIIGKRTFSWYMAGVCLGLGLLSKYTMGLIVPATVVYLLMDKESRHWFRKPQPYLAMLIGLVLFMPVLYWNAQHGWASFVFQGSRRWLDGEGFSLHILIGSILVLITPLGLYEVIRTLCNLWKNRLIIHEADALKFRKYLFLTIFAMVPLSIFVIHSIQGQPKLNWTGPVWLAILPLVAARISGIDVIDSQKKSQSVSKPWIATAFTLLIFYAGGFGHLVAGMPGLTKDSGMKFPIAWKAYGERIEKIESRMESVTNSEPIIIGLDEYWLASQASFYDVDDGDILPETAAKNLVGGNSLMWNFWVSPRTVAGRNGLLVSFTADKLEQSYVTRRFSKLGEITEEVLTNCYGEIGHFYWRAGYNYNPK
ncbi:MAG: glycosyltransferase family 39 protein [candidate division Zixibacteria bacterium]|nr:glycosyltransferase family 39 protein [candidate division Zixibacteria bacterium]MBU1469761.1 glycosyltransferase family 39 protein [candidate division Zixibacteria bacterium]MBU2624969.1 glycosyltransferase family 39 protein [candidate division Zixibacteria bacterium]